MEAVRKGVTSVSQGVFFVLGLCDMIFMTVIWRPFDVFLSGSFPLLTFGALGINVICNAFPMGELKPSSGAMVGILITWLLGIVSMIVIEVCNYHETREFIEKHRANTLVHHENPPHTLFFQWFLWFDGNGFL